MVYQCLQIQEKKDYKLNEGKEMLLDPDNIKFFLIVSVVINIAILVWFIKTLNKINTSIQDIAEYTRRTALSTKLSQGQVKLINHSYSAQELIALFEKAGARLNIQEQTNGAEKRLVLRVENSFLVDPEWIKQIMKIEQEAIRVLRLGKYQS